MSPPDLPQTCDDDGSEDPHAGSIGCASAIPKEQMNKNILIFADGTGQAGGLTPDQKLSNIYKLYRACRAGPESCIDQRQQVAFYDAGLGTSQDGGRFGPALWRRLLVLWSAATGRGISRNITDCYEALLRLYEPGDRIYLFGFSRGAYTVRCLGGVLNLCGIPTAAIDGGPVPRRGAAARAIAREAVRDVYEHGAGRDRARFEPERNELARRFRRKYRSGTDAESNVNPYFIGVFDTVAALGVKGPQRALLLLLLFVLFAGLSFLAAWGASALFGGSRGQWWLVLLTFVTGCSALGMLQSSLRVIHDYPEQGKVRWHLAGWHSGFYDRLLSQKVQYGRHALAIDEKRAAFSRVEWGQKGNQPERPGGLDWLPQVWFAGDHSDIGGSYAEDESRVADIALCWMIGQAQEVPDPILVDRSKLHLFPDPFAMQHCQVAEWNEAMRWLPVKLRPRWKIRSRVEASGAPYHPSVMKRLAASAVLQHDSARPYRPYALKFDPALHLYYEGPEDVVG